MAVTGKEIATAGNVKAAFAKLLGDTKLAQRLRKNMGLGDTLGPLPVEFGGTGGTDRDALMRHLRMNNTSRGFFGATVKSIEKEMVSVKESNYVPSSMRNSNAKPEVSAVKTDAGITVPIVYRYSGTDVEKPVKVAVFSVTRDGVASERAATVESLKTKGVYLCVYGNPVRDALGTVTWVMCGMGTGSGGSINGTQVPAKTPVLVEVSMTADGAVTASHLVTFGFSMPGSGFYYGNVFASEDGSMLLGAVNEQYQVTPSLLLALVTPDRAVVRIDESNLKGVPFQIFEKNIHNVCVSRRGGLNLVQRDDGSGIGYSAVFDDALNVKSVPSASVTYTRLKFDNSPKFPFGAAAAKADPTGLKRFELNERGEVVERLLSPIDGIREFPFGSSGYKEGAPVEVDGEIWVFGKRSGVCDQYGNYSEGDFRGASYDYCVADGDSVFWASATGSGGYKFTVQLTQAKSAFFNEIGYRNA